MTISEQNYNFNQNVKLLRIALKANFGSETKVITINIYQRCSTADLRGNEQLGKRSLETSARNKQKGKNCNKTVGRSLWRRKLI